MKQYLVCQPLDRPQPVSAGPAGGIAVAQTGGDIRDAGAAVQRHDLDPGLALLIGPGQDFTATAMAHEVLCQFGYHDGDAAGVGFIVTEQCGQGADASARVGDVGRIADGDGFHGATSNARW